MEALKSPIASWHGRILSLNVCLWPILTVEQTYGWRWFACWIHQPYIQNYKHLEYLSSLSQRSLAMKGMHVVFLLLFWGRCWCWINTLMCTWDWSSIGESIRLYCYAFLFPYLCSKVYVQFNLRCDPRFAEEAKLYTFQHNLATSLVCFQHSGRWLLFLCNDLSAEPIILNWFDVIMICIWLFIIKGYYDMPMW
jgi:hypothetical protein